MYTRVFFFSVSAGGMPSCQVEETHLPNTTQGNGNPERPYGSRVASTLTTGRKVTKLYLAVLILLLHRL